MKRAMMAFAAAGLLALSMAGAASAQAVNGSDSVAKPNENANCLAVERAERNAKGGDRAQGIFGPEQAAEAKKEGAYGQGL